MDRGHASSAEQTDRATGETITPWRNKFALPAFFLEFYLLKFCTVITVYSYGEKTLWSHNYTCTGAVLRTMGLKHVRPWWYFQKLTLVRTPWRLYRQLLYQGLYYSRDTITGAKSSEQFAHQWIGIILKKKYCPLLLAPSEAAMFPREQEILAKGEFLAKVESSAVICF